MGIRTSQRVGTLLSGAALLLGLGFGLGLPRLGPAAPAAAQVASPAASPEPGSRPGDCDVAPRPLPLFPPATPGTGGATPAPLATATPFALPAGPAADDATVAAVNAVVAEAVACRNAGDWPRAYALFSDAMLVRLFGGPQTVNPETQAALAAPPQKVPRPERLKLLAVSDVRVAPDGRVAAVVRTESIDGTFDDLLFFVPGPDGLLVDEAVAIPPPAATPVP